MFICFIYSIYYIVHSHFNGMPVNFIQEQTVKLIRCIKNKNSEIANLSGENDRLKGK